MVTREIIKECLDILELHYFELEGGAIAVSFNSDDAFPYPIVTVIDVRDCVLSFHSSAIGYAPQGDLFAMANRHNCRSYAPTCHIDSGNNVMMEHGFVLEHDVPPGYLLDYVVRPSIYQPIQAFASFELPDEELISDQGHDNR